MNPSFLNIPQDGVVYGAETIPPVEIEAMSRIEKLTREELHTRYCHGAGPALRDAHPKSHGCVRAEFSICDDIPDDLKVGIFREPRAYPALIRFSNGSPQIGSDQTSDIRGMAIKLLDVKGDKALEGLEHLQTQDFILANHPVMFIRNALDYAEFVTAFNRGRILSFFFSWNPVRWRLHEFITLIAARRKRINNPLVIQYWSQTPYKLGKYAMKFSARPCSPRGTSRSSSRSPNYLKEAMIAQLETSEACFDFLVQLQTASMPIEDPTIRWDEEKSPYRRMAKIRIPAQQFDTPERRAFAENLSFNPWHTLPEHRPLGGINRVRRQVYQSISQLRHQLNDVPLYEPDAKSL